MATIRQKATNLLEAVDAHLLAIQTEIALPDPDEFKVLGSANSAHAGTTRLVSLLYSEVTALLADELTQRNVSTIITNLRARIEALEADTLTATLVDLMERVRQLAALSDHLVVRSGEIVQQRLDELEGA